eukprot:2133279-Prorocentrum_lima.AAC.1
MGAPGQPPRFPLCSRFPVGHASGFPSTPCGLAGHHPRNAIGFGLTYSGSVLNPQECSSISIH